MKLISIDRRKEYVDVLWKLLQERTPEQSISHKRMPSYDEHRQFILLMDKWPGYFLANVSPRNDPSKALFSGL